MYIHIMYMSAKICVCVCILINTHTHIDRYIRLCVYTNTIQAGAIINASNTDGQRMCPSLTGANDGQNVFLLPSNSPAGPNQFCALRASIISRNSRIFTEVLQGQI